MIIACSALYMDCIFNILIDSVNYYKTVCYLSIFCTLTIHYTGYFAIILRAERIFTYMKLESQYLR